MSRRRVVLCALLGCVLAATSVGCTYSERFPAITQAARGWPTSGIRSFEVSDGAVLVHPVLDERGPAPGFRPERDTKLHDHDTMLIEKDRRREEWTLIGFSSGHPIFFIRGRGAAVDYSPSGPFDRDYSYSQHLVVCPGNCDRSGEREIDGFRVLPAFQPLDGCSVCRVDFGYVSWEMSEVKVQGGGEGYELVFGGQVVPEVRVREGEEFEILGPDQKETWHLIQTKNEHPIFFVERESRGGRGTISGNQARPSGFVLLCPGETPVPYLYP